MFMYHAKFMWIFQVGNYLVLVRKIWISGPSFLAYIHVDLPSNKSRDFPSEYAYCSVTHEWHIQAWPIEECLELEKRFCSGKTLVSHRVRKHPPQESSLGGCKPMN